METDVAIVGGGLAGLSCAQALLGSGLRVTVLEASEALGGRARSWTHAASGDDVDIGPHIILSHYPNMLALLDQLGTRDHVHWQTDRLITLLKDGRTDVMRVRRLPPPLHLLPSMAAAQAVNLTDKMSNMRASWRAMKMDESRVMEFDRISAAQFVRECGVNDAFRQWFWNSACMALMNVPLEHCSAGALLRVYAQLVGHNDYAIGFADCGLSELYVPHIQRALADDRSSVTMSCVVRDISVTHSGFELQTSQGMVAARHVVLAITPQALTAVAAKLPALCDVVLRARTFRPSPYVSLYLWFDRKLTDRAFWTGVWTPQRLNYDFYDLSNIRRGWSNRASVITSNIIYNANALAMSDAELVNLTLAEIAEFVPAVRNARVVHADIHRIEMAIPSPTVGTEVARPQTETHIPGLFLAGDWTRTGLPSCMESAVRSGWLASEAVLRRVGRPRSIALPVPQTTGFPALVKRLANRGARRPHPQTLPT